MLRPLAIAVIGMHAVRKRCNKSCERYRCRQPLPQSTTLPPEAYTSEAFYLWEIENIFRNEWICLAHISQISSPGDFLNVDLLGEPLIVVHGKDHQVRVLSRVCPHRAMDIMPPGFGDDGHGHATAKEGKAGRGHTRLFLCPYHAWTFELDGCLKACPEMHLAENFERDAFMLKPFRSEIWNGFVFVNLDGDAPALHERLKEVDGDFGEWKPAEMELIIERAWDCPFNWKVLVENFMESYHHLGAHAKTLQPLMPARDTWNERNAKPTFAVIFRSRNLSCRNGARSKLPADTLTGFRRSKSWPNQRNGRPACS